MRKLLTRLIALLLSVVTSHAFTCRAYDFYSNSTGNVIYYDIRVNDQVYVTSPGSGGDSYSGDIVIPETVTTDSKTYTVIGINSSAFKGCKELTSVTIPETITSIGVSAFCDCIGLTTVNFNATNCTMMGDGYAPVFKGCTSLSTVNIGENVKTIPDCAFYGCAIITKMTLPESVTSIGILAFYNTGIYNKSSNWENDVLYISNCLITAKSTLTGQYAIKENTRVLAAQAFYNCSGLTSVTIPETITSISSQAFYNCSGLTSVTIPETVTTIGDYAFCGTGLTSVTIPETVTTIGDYAFSACSGLTSVTIPESVTTIGEYAFRACTGLTSVTIPETVTTIGDYAFCGTGLTSVTIPASVTTIGGYAFYGCDKLMEKPTRVSSDEFTITCKVNTCNIGAVTNYFVKDSKSAKLGESVTVSLFPAHNFSLEYGFVWKESRCVLSTVELSTKSPAVNVSKSVTATSFRGSLSIYTDYDNELYWEKEQKIKTHITGLDPDKSYDESYILEMTHGSDSWTNTYSVNFKTEALAMATLPGVALNTQTALLCAEANIDEDEENVGFEWRRYDAPSTLPSNKVTCAVDDGKIQGALCNLNPEVYYNFRPYYTSDAGNTYYGEWMTLFTGDANVYFDPTVKTYSAEMVDEYSAVLKGYALRGSYEIASQGFEYWTAWGSPSRADNDINEVIVSGQKMQYKLDGLAPATTYEYRTFAETSKGRVYGDIMSFTTEGTGGIGTVYDDGTSQADVVGYYNLQGFYSNHPYKGYNIVLYSNGITRKIFVR